MEELQKLLNKQHREWLNRIFYLAKRLRWPIGPWFIPGMIRERR